LKRGKLNICDKYFATECAGKLLATHQWDCSLFHDHYRVHVLRYV